MNSTILIVDDAPEQIHIFSAYIHAEIPHTQIITSDSAKGAIVAIEKKLPDLIILDLLLKGSETGEEVLNHLRKISKKIPVLIVTGQNTDQILTNLFHLGADDYIMKPVDELIFQSKVRSLLDSRYISPMLFQGRREGLGRFEVTTELQILSINEFQATYISRFFVLAGALLRISLDEFEFECKVTQSLPTTNGDAYHLICDVHYSTLKDRAAFRRYLLKNKNESTKTIKSAS